MVIRMIKKTFLSHNSDLHERMDEVKGGRWFTETFRDVFILGLCYAARKNLEPLELEEGKIKESIRINEVIRDEHMFLFRVVAFYHTKDYNILTDENRIFEIIEKLSNAGVKELLEKYYRSDYPNFDLAQIVLEK